MDLRTISAPADPLCAKLVDHADLTLLLDLDGTLIPFAARPEDAKLDSDAASILGALHEAAVQVVIVSGRPQGLLSPLRALAPHAWWVAEHGTWRCDSGGTWTGPPTTPELADLTVLLGAFTRIPGARVEVKSLSLCLHWRMVPGELKEHVIRGAALVCDEWLESHADFERIAGAEMMEVRQRSANKGTAVAWVRERLPGARLVAIGDDDTDDDMFAALNHDELAIGVGRRPSLRIARRLADLAAVRSFLRWLVEARTGGANPPFPSLQRRDAVNRSRRAPLVIVSNRTPPISTDRQRPVGGLVSALEPALRSHGGIWLGWSGRDSEGERPLIVDHDVRPARASFDLSVRWRERFYAGFCNRALWPLFHGFPGRVCYQDVDWEAYVDANEEFARHANHLAAGHAKVWIHDYHLLLAGQSLRRRGFEGKIGLFLHIPFPARDLFGTLPWADELLAGMCAFDLVGFHTAVWASNFRDCVGAWRGSMSIPELAVLPIGVDPRAFAPADAPPDPEIAGLCAMLGPRRLLLGVDRLDYAKGIPERLLGFERLLEKWPEWRGKISFVQISVPSREDVPEYAELRHRVERLVGRINGRFGEADWVPVRYLYRSYDHAILAQLYRAADVALVTPLRDGLNLVAKEFVLAQNPARPGVLVLSKFAGAAAELPDAVLTNPFHADGMASDIDRALRMSSAEREQRHTRMAASLAGMTPDRWATAFLDRLANAARSPAPA
jgi:alpha,alpha-trehalose-phosphate synthase [UDP-forming]/trehalose-phosphatase